MYEYPTIIYVDTLPVESTYSTEKPLPLAHSLPEDEPYTLYAEEIDGKVMAVAYVTRVINGIEMEVPYRE